MGRSHRDVIADLLETPTSRVALASGLIVTVALVIAYVIVCATGLDVDVYRAGGAAVLHGHPLYSSGFKTPTNSVFTYPPFSAMLFIPLSLVGHRAGIISWDLCTVVAAGGLLAVSLRASIRSRLCRKSVTYCVIFGGAAAASLAPVQDALREGQIGVFLALMCVADVALPAPRWPRGFLVGVAAAIKLTPGIFLIYFIATKNWKAARTMGATLITAWALSALILPRDSYAYFGQGLIFDASRVGKANDPMNESLNGLWHRLGVGAPTAWWVGSAVLITVLGLVRARRATDRGDVLAAAVIIGLVSELDAPISWLHHDAWVIPAIVWLAWSPAHRVVARVAAVAVTVVLLIPYANLTGDDAHWPRGLVETYVVLFLLIVAFLPIRKYPSREIVPEGIAAEPARLGTALVT